MHKRFEYPVKPLLHEGMAVEVYSVNEVEAVIMRQASATHIFLSRHSSIVVVDEI